jgi:Fic family protein
MKKTQTLTAEETEFLSESNKIEREYGFEAMEDAIKAWKIAKECKDPFTIPSLLKIHAVLLKRLAPHYAGNIRQGTVYIGGAAKEQSKEEIIESLNILFKDFKSVSFLKNDSDAKEEYTKKWHVQYEGIHPFFDGNGRTGRILMNLQRIKLGLPILVIHEGREQMEYYKWFKENSKWYHSFDHGNK